MDNLSLKGLRLQWVYFLISIAILVFFPIWLVIQNKTLRFIIFLFSVSVFLILNLIMKRKLDNPKFKESKKLRLYKKDLFLILFTATLIQFLFIFQPITFYSDEISYISSGMYLTQAVNSLLGYLAPIALIIFFVLIYFSFRYKQTLLRYIFKRYDLFILIIIISSIIYFFGVSHIFEIYANSFSGKDISEKSRYFASGLKLIIYSIPFIIAGINEISARIPGFLAYCFSSVLLYLILINHKNRKLALYSAITLLILPGFFYFGSLAYDVCFVTLSFLSFIFFYLRYKQTRNFDDLIYSFIIPALGVFYERKIILVFMSIVVFVFFNDFLKNYSLVKRNYLIVLILTLPLFIFSFISNLVNFSSQVSNSSNTSISAFSNFLNFNKVLQPLEVIPYITGWFALIFIILGLIIIIKKESLKDPLIIFFLFSVIIFYAYYVSYNFLARPRFFAPLSFIFAILFSTSLCFIESLSNKLKSFSFLLIILLAGSTISLAYNNYENRYLPVNELFNYIANNGLTENKFLKSMAPSSYNFYILKYNLNMNNFDPTIWQEASNQTEENLFSYMIKNNESYAFFPLPTSSYDIYFYHPNPSSWLDIWDSSYDAPHQIINHTLILNIYKNESFYFTKVAEFKKGKNTIFLVKTKILNQNKSQILF